MTSTTKLLQFSIGPGARWRRCLTVLAATLCVTTAIAPAGATVVTDPANDFIPTFGGTKSGDIDALSAFGTFDGAFFHIGATLNGTVGTLPTSLYVFGFNRGAGLSNFAAIGLPDVIFDAVITLTGTGVLGGRDLVANTAIALSNNLAHISGSSITIDIPLAALPSEGFAPDRYQLNFWPRDTAAAGNAALADFAPNATDFVISQVPEPDSIALLFAGGAMMIAVIRRTRARVDALVLARGAA